MILKYMIIHVHFKFNPCIWLLFWCVLMKSHVVTNTLLGVTMTTNKHITFRTACTDPYRVYVDNYSYSGALLIRNIHQTHVWEPVLMIYYKGSNSLTRITLKVVQIVPMEME